MATLERPKKNKTKKSAPKTSEVNTIAEESMEKNVASFVNKENLTTSEFKKSLPPNVDDINELVASTSATRSDIVIKECFIASACNENDSINQDKKPSLSGETKLKNAEREIEQAVDDNIATPSAPPSSHSIGTKEAVNLSSLVHYPKVEQFQYEEATAAIAYNAKKTRANAFRLSATKIQPLTQEQLNQYYYCSDLVIVQQFEMEYLMNSLLETYEGDPLFEALKEYYHMQSKLTMNLHDIKKFRKEANAAQEHIWVEVPITETFTQRCGDNIEVKTSVTYNILQVDGKRLELASLALSDLFDIVSDTYINNFITTNIIKMRIDQMIEELKCCHTRDFNETLKLQSNLDSHELAIIAKLRRALSILFHFSRKLAPNKYFDTDLKYWFDKLISLHLHLATKEDHWFLLFNILRCPSGVGAWASKFVQIPCNQSIIKTKRTNELPLQLNSPEINHCMSVLHVLTMTVKKRNDYLKQFSQEITDPVTEERWILIDSDGEDSCTPTGDCVGLKECDLIALLNQIPFEVLFRSALSIEKFLDDYILEADLITTEKMLQVLAFFSQLITLFGEGMLTYNNERYKQFAKRLGRLMRHSLQYASDYQELFKQNNQAKDFGINERMAMENKSLLLKACKYIYCTRNLSTWQYFSSFPFSSLEPATLWQIFYFLNVGFPENTTQEEDYQELLNASDFWPKFNVANADLSDEDLYYLLQAFFEMANDRDENKDWAFIETICLHIFQIGFINKDTRDICYKTSRDMLLNLTIIYKNLTSCLLAQLKARFRDCENASYLFKSLQLESWQPSFECFETISNWLLHFDYSTAENMLARLIITKLNWSFDGEGNLFLPHNIHVRMACLISDALTKHAPEVVGLSGVSESVRQVSSLIDFTQSTKQQFSTWCWSIISMLRLHIMDQNVEQVKLTLRNPTEALIFVSELERIDLIYQGVTANRPLALYVAILVSLHGHSIPLICQKGFELMQRLLSDHRHAAVIRCLQLVVPLFLETPDTLGNTERFQSILNTLLNADKTYLKMAKDMLYPNAVGPVLDLLDNMIHHQICSYTSYGLSSPLNLINIWLYCLTAQPNWQNTYVVYLLDKILRVAYQFPDAHVQSIEFFHNYYKECTDWKGINKKSTLKGFFSSNQSNIPAISPNYPWLALVLLEIEFKTQDSIIWPELLRQLNAVGHKPNLDVVLKKTLTIAKINVYPANMLVLYKYGNLLAEMNVQHALFPIVNQKFFELYLARLPIHYDEHSFQQVYGVADKFYDHNITMMKKIKSQLVNAEVFYLKESSKNNLLCNWYINCANLMRSYIFWLEDTALNKMSSDQLNFPPQHKYNNAKLKEIFDGNTIHWTEFLCLPAMRKEQRYQADQWARICFRLKGNTNLRSFQTKAKTSPLECIKSHLRSYDEHLPPPFYFKPEVNLQYQITQLSLNKLKEKLKVLTSTATKIHLMKCELNAISRNYIDNIINLYSMVPYEEIKIKNCDSLLFNRTCSQPARIKTTLKTIRKNTNVEKKITSYRERYDAIVNEFLNENVNDFAICAGQIGQILQPLLVKSSDPQSALSQLKSKIGTGFYYHVLDNMSDITMKFNATNKFYTELLNELAIFIQENQESEGLKILDLALKRPELIKTLSGVFMPSQTRPPYFLKMYKFLIDSHLKRCDTKILFVLFSKFDLIIWLESYRPKLFDINNLLQMVMQGLESWSSTDSSLLQDQFRRHLIHIYDFDFPEHYGEIIQMVLEHISEKKIMPMVVLDLLNRLLSKSSCEQLDLSTDQAKLEEISMNFATKQNLFNLKAVTDTVMLLAHHFQKERLNHGLHGLYPKHEDYCKPLSMWFSCFGRCLLVKAVCTYQELLTDQISDLVFGPVIEMYSPWLVIYTEQTIQQSSANWIRQLINNVNGKMLYPWSQKHTDFSKIMIKNFIRTLIFILEHLPTSHKILLHTFSWYIHHFSIPNIESHIYGPIHEGIAELPWELFKPQVEHIDMLYETLHKFVPQSHAMLGHIFIRINWNEWFSESLPKIPALQQTTVVSRLFTIFIKIAFEPNIHMHVNASKILEDAINYPWYMIEFVELENLLKWFVTTSEPTIILKIPSETNYVDRAVLDLIRLACAMMPERGNQTQNIRNATAKRILYTRSMIRLQRACAAKHPKLLATKEGYCVFKNAFVDLLNTLNLSLCALAAAKTQEEQRREALNVMLEIVLPMQTQSEETSNLHIDCIVNWQELHAQPGNLLMCSILSSIGHMKTFIGGTYTLLEASIAFYFRSSQDSLDWHTPSWVNLFQVLQMSLEKLSLMPIMKNSSMFTLHVFILYKMEKMPTVGDQITFLQDLSQLVADLKTEPHNEPIMAAIWGAMISWGCKILTKEPQNGRKALKMFARHLQIISTQSEGWGDSILGAVGLKRDVVTNKRKVLTRCLAIVIFSLFPYRSHTVDNVVSSEDYESSMRELSMLLANKKFNDIKALVVQSIGILNENKMPQLNDVSHLVCRLISLFYSNGFLTTVPEVWEMNFTIPCTS